jgi:hypothetical protein
LDRGDLLMRVTMKIILSLVREGRVDERD